MYSSEDFSDGLVPPQPINLKVKEFKVDEFSSSAEKIDFNYGKEFELLFNLKSVSIPSGFLSLGEVDPTLSIEGFEESERFMCLEQKYESNGLTSLKFTPKKEPILFGRLAKAIKITGVVVNGIDVFGKTIEFKCDNSQLRAIYRPFKSAHDFHKNKKSAQNKFVATGLLEVERFDGASIDPSVAWKVMYAISRCMTFAKGGKTGVGHIVGTDENQVEAYYYLGFSRFDELDADKGWFELGCLQDLPEFLSLFYSGLLNDLDGTSLLRASEFYRVSNASEKSSREIAIVASQTALEILVHHILGTRGGWSNSLLEGRTPFHDKLRATSSLIGLATNPLEHSPKLQAKSTSFNGADGFEMLTLIRNSIVHPNTKRNFEGLALFEAWNLSQWLCELFVFSIIGYKGKMNDRRRYSGWRGEGIAVVPIAGAN